MYILPEIVKQERIIHSVWSVEQAQYKTAEFEQTLSTALHYMHHQDIQLKQLLL